MYSPRKLETTTSTVPPLKLVPVSDPQPASESAPPQPISGLTSAEVAERVAAGQTNAVHHKTSRSIPEIIRANVFTWFNLILGVLWAFMITFGSWRDALFGFVLIFNTAIGVAQELRAKATLDRLSLISAPRARVIRDGETAEIAVGDVVLGDIVVLSPGDQLVADAITLTSEGLEIDESALTGESVPVAKRVDDPVLSGSFVVAGSGLCRTTAVGANAYAMRIEAEGRRFTRTHSDVMDGINRILRAIGIVMIPMAVLTIISTGRSAGDVSSRVTNTVAALVPMVPEGLVLLSSIAFALSAIALARHHVLVNELPAVEGLARTDVVLADKTGTLTERDPAFGRFEPLPEGGVTEAAALRALAELAAADPAPNSTMRAIAAGVVSVGETPQAGPGESAGGSPWETAAPRWTPRASVPFSPARKWSAVDFGDNGAWVLGAPDIMLDAVEAAATARDRLAALTAEGPRVLLLARSAGPVVADRLPDDLVPVGFVVLTERLRPDAADTVRYLGEEGVSIKIISGDSARTVSTIALAAGVPDAERAMDARRLVLASPGATPNTPAGAPPLTGGIPSDAAPETSDALLAAMRDHAVFGRVMPEQKSAMVVALQRDGHTVAMTGDGVNDVLALKQADLGIAMGAGVPAARAVAQVVLLDNRFATLPLVMAEGRRVVANAERVANLFLTKSVWAFLLALAVGVAGLPYPFLPRHITLAGSLAIGIPAFFFALAPNPRLYRPGFVKRVLRFAIPSGAVIVVAVFATYLAARAWGVPLEHVRTLSTLVLTLVSLAVIAVLEWPISGWKAGVVLGMLGLLAGAFAVPFARDFFELAVPTLPEFAAITALSAVAVALIAALTTRVRRAVRAPAR